MTTPISSAAPAAGADPFAFLKPAGTSAASGGSAAPNSAQQSDRFLKLLTAQLQNQDPMNPLDNAQMTSQVAQISTVTGIEKLDASIGKLADSLRQSQAVQGAALVGRSVDVPGNRLDVADGRARGAFELTSAADRVRVDLLDAAGRVVGGKDLGAQSAGLQTFDLEAPPGAGRYRVSAFTGATALQTRDYAVERVESVSAGASGLTLQLGSGAEVAFDAVRAVH